MRTREVFTPDCSEDIFTLIVNQQIKQILIFGEKYYIKEIKRTFLIDQNVDGEVLFTQKLMNI